MPINQADTEYCARCGEALGSSSAHIRTDGPYCIPCAMIVAQERTEKRADEAQKP